MFRFDPLLVSEVEKRVLPTLELGLRQGIIGPGSLQDHIQHALGFGVAWHSYENNAHGNTRHESSDHESCDHQSSDQENTGHEDKTVDPRSVVDLGSGAGLPALVLALVWPKSAWILAETRGKRAEFLTRAVHRLGLTTRVEVWGADVQDLPDVLDSRVELVTARAFGAPGLTAECAAGLLQSPGTLVVSEPGRLDAPAFSARWPTAGLESVGMGAAEPVATGGHQYAVIPRRDDSPVTWRSRRHMERQPAF